MRILSTHKKKNAPAWLRRVELLPDWEAYVDRNWHKHKPSVGILYSDLKWAWKFFRTSRKYDVLLTGSERIALVVALMQKLVRRDRRVPHVFLECMWTLPQGRFARWKRRLLLRWVAEAADRIVVYSRHQIDAYSNLLGVSKHKFAFVHSHSTLYNKVYPAVAGAYIFSGGYTNRDYPTLLEAVRGLPYPTVICVGSKRTLGPEIPANVEVFENLSEDDFNRHMAASAFVVVPLRAAVLEMGGRQVLQNAMTMGKAVIVSDTTATDYITNNITGLLVPPENPALLREAILFLISNRAVAEQLGREAQKLSTEFTPEKFFERLFAIVEDSTQRRAATMAQRAEDSAGTTG